MLNRALQGATAAADKLYIESVFSTWLYTGNGSTQTITNGIDLAGQGGMVWIKSRNLSTGGSGYHLLQDSARGIGNTLYTNDTAAQTNNNLVTAFNGTGFSLGAGSGIGNETSATYASWTFRKAAKFFDVVTYTGNGVAGRTVAHNLGSVPGCMIVKSLGSPSQGGADGYWFVYHRGLSTPESGTLYLNSTDSRNAAGIWNNTLPTSAVFSLGGDNNTNINGRQYVAYLFAHDAGGFGDSGNDSVVKCGLASGSTRVDLGWEPQLVLFKGVDAGYNWEIFDNMRGMTSSLGSSDDASLVVNSANAEAASNRIKIDATGFETNISINHIYIAIRRGPMKTPTDATKVFSADTSSGASSTLITTGFASDLAIYNLRGGAGANSPFVDRLRGLAANSSSTSQALLSSSTAAEGGYSVGYEFWNTGFRIGSYYGGSSNVFYSFRRAPGFFDVVAYTGTGANRTVSHNLGVAPELMIVKSRTVVRDWRVYSAALGATKNIILNTNGANLTTSNVWNDTAPTSTVFTVGTNPDTNSTDNYIAYLFATLAGVSKVGSYTGTGTTKDIDCGFTNGARFVLIKRTDSTGDWYVWDTARGIVSGNDNYLLLNSTAAEVTNTDYIDPLSSGFQISSTAPAAINANGGSFIFLAIA